MKSSNSLSPISSFVSVALLLVAAGCSGASSDNGESFGSNANTGGSAGSGGGTASGGSGGGVTTTLSCEGENACAAPSPGDPNPTAMCVETVTALLLTPSGAPVPNFGVQVCGTDQCHRAKSDANGKVEFAVCQPMDSPAFEVVGGSRYVTYAVPLATENTSFSKVTLVPLSSDGATFPAQASGDVPLSAGPVTLTLTPGTTVNTFSLDCPEPDEQLLRAASVPLDQGPPSMDASLGIEMLIGLAPGCVSLSAPARLTIPNDAAWPAGTAVEIMQHGTDPFNPEPAPFGGWAVVAIGHVDGNGQTISTDAVQGNGIMHLALVGVRRQ